MGTDSRASMGAAHHGRVHDGGIWKSIYRDGNWQAGFPSGTPLQALRVSSLFFFQFPPSVLDLLGDSRSNKSAPPSVCLKSSSGLPEEDEFMATTTRRFRSGGGQQFAHKSVHSGVCLSLLRSN